MKSTRSGVIVNNLIEEGLARLEKYQTHDEEFLARFGKWQRPEFAERYPLWEMINRTVRWDPRSGDVLDVSNFVRSLREEDRYIAGEIARFVAEEYLERFVTDKTLQSFKVDFARRLDACGF